VALKLIAAASSFELLHLADKINKSFYHKVYLFQKVIKGFKLNEQK